MNGVRSRLLTRVQGDLRKIRERIDQTCDPSKKAKLIRAYVDLLETLDVKMDVKEIGKGD